MPRIIQIDESKLIDRLQAKDSFETISESYNCDVKYIKAKVKKLAIRMLADSDIKTVSELTRISEKEILKTIERSEIQQKRKELKVSQLDIQTVEITELKSIISTMQSEMIQLRAEVSKLRTIGETIISQMNI